MPQVNIPGVGRVNFPDSMSNEEIAAQAKKLYDGANGGTPTVQAQPAQPTPPPAPANVDGQVAPQAPPEMRQQGPRSTGQRLADEFNSMSEDEQISNSVEVQKGLFQTGVNMLLNGAGAVVGGVAAAPLIADPDLAKTAFDKVSSYISGFGFDSPGQQAVTNKVVAPAIEKVDQVVTNASWALSGGHPLAATAIKTAIMLGPSLVTPAEEAAPALLGKPVTGRLASRKAQLALSEKLEKTAADMGINFKAPELGEQISDAAGARVGTARGQFMIPLREKLLALRDQAKQAADAKFKEARQMDAKVRARSINELYLDTIDQLTNAEKGVSYDIDNMPKVKERLDDIKALAQAENERAVVKDRITDPGTGKTGFVERSVRAPDRHVELDELSKLRARINSNRPAANDLDQIAALRIIKGQINKFIDDQFMQDMIVGDPAAKAAWREATDLWRDYKSRFKDNKILREIIEKEASPEDMRKFLQGLSETGAKTEAAQVVRKLKEILPPDSPEMQGLRREFILDYVQPLLEDTPNFKKFNKVYEKLQKNNPTLIKELDPFSATQLDMIYKMSKAYERIGPAPKIVVNLSRNLARLLVGHGIAKAAVKVTLVEQLVKVISKGGGRAQRKAMIQEILGDRPNIPFIDPKSVTAQAILVGEIQDRMREAEQQ